MSLTTELQGARPPPSFDSHSSTHNIDTSNTDLPMNGEKKAHDVQAPKTFQMASNPGPTVTSTPIIKPKRKATTPLNTGEPIEEDAWNKAFFMAKEFDDSMCEGWVDEIQNTLLFAALFSAVVTAFAIQTLQLLTDDPSRSVTSLLLAQIAVQLSANDSTINTILQPVQQSLNTAPGTAQGIRINCFIFVSLILSLGSALIGIVALQWIRSYRKREFVFQRHRLSVRQSQYQGLFEWNVPDIILSLPVFLLLSLATFFIGLLDFLRLTNTLLAIVAGVSMAPILGFLIWTTARPAIFILRNHMKSKPSLTPLPAYQSPQALIILKSILKIAPPAWFDRLFVTSPSTWTDFLMDPGRQTSCDHWLPSALAWMFQHFNSVSDFDKVYKCFLLTPTLHLAVDALKRTVIEGRTNFSIDDQCFDQGPEPTNGEVDAYPEFLSLVLLTWHRLSGPISTALKVRSLKLYEHCLKNWGSLSVPQQRFLQGSAEKYLPSSELKSRFAQLTVNSAPSIRPKEDLTSNMLFTIIESPVRETIEIITPDRSPGSFDADTGLFGATPSPEEPSTRMPLSLSTNNLPDTSLLRIPDRTVIHSKAV